jgi:hypothetical protein
MQFKQSFEKCQEEVILASKSAGMLYIMLHCYLVNSSASNKTFSLQ